jgi:Na+/melibiose symporter-like transporter
MATKKEKLAKGIRFLFGALPLMFIGPSVIYNAFMNKNHNGYYVVLVAGCIICISSVFLAFRGIKTLTDALFDGEQ